MTGCKLRQMTQLMMSPALASTAKRVACPVRAAGRDRAEGEIEMNSETDPLAQFGLEAIDLRWTMRDIAGRRSFNKDHLVRLIDLGMVAMRGDAPYLTPAGQNAAWGTDG